MTRFSHFVLGCIFSLGALAWGQSFGGRIVGLATDSSTAAIPGAIVTIENEGTGAQRHIVSDSSGTYVAAELPVGYYRMRFESPGLGKSERQGVKVDVGGENRVDVTLSPPSKEQSIYVQPEVPRLQRESR